MDSFQSKEILLSYLNSIGIVYEIEKYDFTPFDFIKTPFFCIHFIELSVENKTLLSDSFYAIRISTKVNYSKLIIIWSDQIIHSFNQVKARLDSYLNNNKRIFARKTELVRLNSNQADLFLANYHLMGSCSTKFKYALSYQGELIAVAAFSSIRNFTRNNLPVRSSELIRFAQKEHITIVGGLSKLIQYFMKLHDVQHLMTYVDLSWSKGEGFEKIGFKPVSQTFPQKMCLNMTTQLRTTSEHESNENDFLSFFNAGSLKLVLFE